MNNQVTLTRVAKTKNDSLQIEISDSGILRPNSVSSALQELNAGDDRFNNNSTRMAWAKVTLEGLAKIKGVTAQHIEQVKSLKEVGDAVELNIVAPTLKGKELRVEVRDSLVPDEYQQENWESSAKQLEITEKLLQSKTPHTAACEEQVGERGYFINEANRSLIFSKTSIVLCDPDTEPRHNFIDGTLHTLEEVRSALQVSPEGEVVDNAPEI